MSREAHVRICEGVGVGFPHATRLFYFRLPTHPLPEAEEPHCQAGGWISGSRQPGQDLEEGLVEFLRSIAKGSCGQIAADLNYRGSSTQIKNPPPFASSAASSVPHHTLPLLSP